MIVFVASEFAEFRALWAIAKAVRAAGYEVAVRVRASQRELALLAADACAGALPRIEDGAQSGARAGLGWLATRPAEMLALGSALFGSLLDSAFHERSLKRLFHTALSVTRLYRAQRSELCLARAYFERQPARLLVTGRCRITKAAAAWTTAAQERGIPVVSFLQCLNPEVMEIPAHKLRERRAARWGYRRWRRWIPFQPDRDRDGEPRNAVTPTVVAAVAAAGIRSRPHRSTLPFCQPDWLLLEASSMRPAYAGLLADDRIVVTGHPFADRIVESRRRPLHERRLRLLVNPPKWMLSAPPGGPTHGSEELKHFAAALADLDAVDIVVSLHPKVHPEITRWLSERGWTVRVGGIEEDIAEADIVVSGLSSIMKWVLAAGTPLIAYGDVPRARRLLGVPLEADGTQVAFVEEPAGLAAPIERLRRQLNAGVVTGRGLQEWGPMDGRCGARILEAIQNAMRPVTAEDAGRRLSGATGRPATQSLGR